MCRRDERAASSITSRTNVPRLAPVVIVGVMGVRGKHHVAVGVPARGFAVAHGVGAWTTFGIRRVHRVGHLHVPHRAILAVAVHRRDGAFTGNWL
jgi:hypothetical protein